MEFPEDADMMPPRERYAPLEGSRFRDKFKPNSTKYDGSNFNHREKVNC